MSKHDQSYKNALTSLEEKLILKRYSQSTIKTYRYMFREFLKYLYPMALHQVSVKEINSYHYQLVTKKKISRSYQNQSINAIKFYLEQVLGNSPERYRLERPKKVEKLPVILTMSEICQLLNNTQNLKHRTILTTLYSAGLRVGEILNLRIKDIDSKSMRIWVCEGKGVKDRVVMLSPVLLRLLRSYYQRYKPKDYLFESPAGGMYSAVSIRKVLVRSCKKSGIKKHVVPHTLRHSFATHLLENGTNLRYIQTLLGHGNIRTTEIYTHVNSKKLEEVISPLDLMAEKKYI